MQYITLKGNVASKPQIRKNTNGKEYVAFSVFDNPAKRMENAKSPLCGVTVYSDKAKEIASSLEIGQFVELHGDINSFTRQDGTEVRYMTPNFVRQIKRKAKSEPKAEAKAE